MPVSSISGSEVVNWTRSPDEQGGVQRMGRDGGTLRRRPVAPPDHTAHAVRVVHPVAPLAAHHERTARRMRWVSRGWTEHIQSRIASRERIQEVSVRTFRRQRSSCSRRRSGQGASAGGGVRPNTPIKRSSNSNRLRFARSQPGVCRVEPRSAQASHHSTTNSAAAP